MIEDDLAKAEFFVDADSFARQILWERFAKQSADLRVEKAGWPNVDWEQDGMGFSAVIGWYGDHPVNVAFFGAKLNGKLVVFYEAVSRVTDSIMLEQWIKDRANPRWDNGTRPAFTDACNFHHCLEHVMGRR